MVAAKAGRTMAGAGVDPDIRVEADGYGRRASYEREAPHGHEAPYGRNALHHHEASYRHGTSSRPETSRGPDRDIEAALKAATSETVFEMAQAAGNSRSRQNPGQPLGN